MKFVLFLVIVTFIASSSKFCWNYCLKLFKIIFLKGASPIKCTSINVLSCGGQSGLIDVSNEHVARIVRRSAVVSPNSGPGDLADRILILAGGGGLGVVDK